MKDLKTSQILSLIYLKDLIDSVPGSPEASGQVAPQSGNTTLLSFVFYTFIFKGSGTYS
nr:hypothetical protein [uncultured Draconibacterium sp.]